MEGPRGVAARVAFALDRRPKRPSLAPPLTEAVNTRAHTDRESRRSKDVGLLRASLTIPTVRRGPNLRGYRLRRLYGWPPTSATATSLANQGIGSGEGRRRRLVGSLRTICESASDGVTRWGAVSLPHRTLSNLVGRWSSRAWRTFQSRWFTMLITLPSGARTKNRRTPQASVVSGCTIS